MKFEDLRIIQLLVGEEWGGAERFFEKLAVAFARRGVKQKLAIMRNPARANQLRAKGCDVEEFDFGKGMKDFFARRELAISVRAFQPHAVIVWMNRAARRMPKGDFVRIGRLGGYYDLRNYRKCDWLIANTPDLRRHIVEQGWPEDRAVMISNFGELEPAPPIARSTFDTPEDALLLLAMGRFHPMKGFDVAIRALTRLPDAWLWLAGDGPLLGELMELAKSLKVAERVRFLGWRDDQAALLSTCDICAVPSRHEPLSNVIIEAWSLGVPVVAAASEGPSWLIEHGKTGLLNPIDDWEAFGDSVKELIEDKALRERVARGGQEKWCSQFSEDAICKKYLGFISNACEQDHYATT